MDHIRIAVADGVRRITLNRAESLNALTPDMHYALEEAFNAFAMANDEHVCVLTGTGRAFCAGTDLKAVVASGGHRAYPPHGYGGIAQRFDCVKPIIAAVNGLALGGGFELALACDLIIASDAASFGLPEPLVGAVALGGGIHRLARQIGHKQALGMILTSRRVSAEDGLRFGFVNEVVPAADLDAAVARWCAEILAASPMSIRASKDAFYRGLDEVSLADAMANQGEYPAYAAWRQSEDAREGPRAFAEKRKPVWQGK